MGRPLYNNYFFFIDNLLIDSGPSHLAEEVIAALRSLPLEKVVITHQHEDHTGNCALIKKHFGINIYAHPDTNQIMKDPPPIQIYRRIMWGNQPPVEAKPLENTVTTEHYQFHVLHTPGHSADHVSFFEPVNKWLFCGDLYLGETLNGFMSGENIASHLTSLQNMIALKPEILFCGLKGRLDNAQERLQRKYDIWWDLGCKVCELNEAGMKRKEILAKAFGGEALFYFLSQSNWGRGFMLDSIIENKTFFTTGQKKESSVGPVINR